MKFASFLLAITAFAQTPPADQTGSISGVVTDAVTHLPVKKAMVTIGATGNSNGTFRGPQSAITDASGAFTISNVQAGKYRVMFQHQNYPQARFGGVFAMVDVKAGESAGSVNIELIPGAAVTGRVLDEDGDPLANCFVRVHPAKNPEQGAPMMGGSGSDQDGVYRAFGIAPGKYVLSAQCGQTVFQPRPFSAGTDPPPSKAYPEQYYPLALDAKSAQPVEMTAGNEKSGIDFQMIPSAITQVHGVFSPAGADWHSSNHINLVLNSYAPNGPNLGGMPNLQKGTFDFRQVFPGSYLLVAFSQGGEEKHIGAWQKIDVADKPLDVVLELHHGFNLTGKVEIESSGNHANKLVMNQIFVQLIPSRQFGMPGAGAQVAEDGTFTLEDVLPAPWHLQVNAPNSFVKSISFGGADVTNAPIDLSSGSAAPLKIVVSTNTATISGSAPAAMTVMAQRLDDDPNRRQNHGAGVDQNGQYKLAGLPPGKYRLVVMDSGGPMPEEGGQEVTVREGESVMADLKAPSAQ
jgi:hypothetical protein